MTATRRRQIVNQSPRGIFISWKTALITAVIALVAVLAACGSGGTTAPNVVDTRNTDAQMGIYNKILPVPLYDYSVERDVMIQIYNQRMKAVDTYSVAFSFGKPIWACPSKGYPIPYTTQLTNPQRIDDNHNGNSSFYAAGVVAQAEPNGLYTGTTTSTWVLCVRALAGGGSEVVPVYAEPDVIAFPFPVKVNMTTGEITDPGSPSGNGITITTKAPATPTPAPTKQP